MCVCVCVCECVCVCVHACVLAEKATKILKTTYFNENILWFYISVEDAVPVHVVDGFAQLVHVELHLLLRKRGSAICS